MAGLDERDFFLDPEVLLDPFAWYDRARARGPIVEEPHHGVFMVTGYDEALAIYHDTERFSSCNSVTGPFPGFPVPLEGDDVSGLIEQYRDQLPMSDQLPTFDPPHHTKHRALLMRLLSPSRLKRNEEFMWTLADRQIDEFAETGQVEFARGYAGAFTLLVVADLLGVPEEDHALFEQRLQGHGDPHRVAGSIRGDARHGDNPLAFFYEYFSRYVEDRREQPRGDVMTGLAEARFPDGELPEVIDVVRIAANLFAAGQETTARLLSAALQILAQQPALQERLRGRRDAIPNFVEEVLRYEGPIKGSFRLARVPVELAGVKIPAGATVMVLNGAANRDPRVFPDPNRFDPERANARQNLAFSHGAHFCPGASLARAEARVTLERIFDRLGALHLGPQHGSPEAPRFSYAPSYILRGLEALHLSFEPA